MFEKIIEFSCHEDYVNLKQDYPEPIKLNIPEWYKKLDFNLENKTIRGCIPFLDTLTTGYVLKNPVDIYIKHNVLNDKGEQDSFQRTGLTAFQSVINAKFININSSIETHPIEQLKGSPLIDKNKNLPFYKILNPWKIKTPKGYSCLFVPPLNNSDDRFSIISGIVDTDNFPIEINFPIVINGDKYPILETTIKKGTSYVQVIPFKRDNWKMVIKNRKQNDIQISRIGYSLKLMNMYRENFWKKKLFK
jgi:hypothetical protein